MAKVQTIKFNEFMNGSYKDQPKKDKKGGSWKKARKVATTALVPLAFAPKAFAQGPEAVTVGATQFIGEKSLEVIAHALDPVVQLLVALSFPVASVIIVGSCFFFMFGNPEKAWSTMQNAGLGYVLINLMPMLLSVLKEVGKSIV